MMWGKVFERTSELAEYAEALCGSSYDEFEEFCKALIDDDGVMCPQFEAWLTVVGKKMSLWRGSRASRADRGRKDDLEFTRFSGSCFCGLPDGAVSFLGAFAVVCNRGVFDLGGCLRCDDAFDEG